MSKIGVIADIHSDLQALKKAIGILKEEYVDGIVVCGDVVGYGTSPNECCEMIRALGCPVVAGNHDWAVAGLTEYKESHSSEAVKGIDYTRKVISGENLRWLQNLPLHHDENGVEFVHASLVKAEKWHYLTHRHSFSDSDWHDIGDNFAALKGQVLFVGHSHRPAIFLEKRLRSIKVINPNKEFYALKGRRSIIDIGSVGLPRNGSGRASLAIYDTDTKKVCFKWFTIYDNIRQVTRSAKEEWFLWEVGKSMVERWFRRVRV